VINIPVKTIYLLVDNIIIKLWRISLSNLKQYNNISA